MNASHNLGGHQPPDSAQAAAIVRAFWKYMTLEYSTVAVSKATAPEMLVAAQALRIMGILDAETFLRNYTTTIGRRIYVPFEPGRAANGWSLWDQIEVCVHEHQHVVQLDRDGWAKFCAKYLLSSASRAAYEAEAYACDMELCFWRSGEVLDPHTLANKLQSYGCSPGDIAVAEAALRSSAATVRRGGLINAATQKAVPWLSEHALIFKVLA